jgi:hypothetical protein
MTHTSVTTLLFHWGFTNDQNTGSYIGHHLKRIISDHIENRTFSLSPTIWTHMKQLFLTLIFIPNINVPLLWPLSPQLSWEPHRWEDNELPRKPIKMTSTLLLNKAKANIEILRHFGMRIATELCDLGRIICTL